MTDTATKLKSIYLSGPMSGVPEHNFPLFNRVADDLRDFGWTVNNPAENFDGRTDLPREQYMRVDVEHLLKSDCILMLPGWEKSRGANMELALARELGLPIFVWVNDDMDEAFHLVPDPHVLNGTTPPPTNTTGEVRMTDPKTGGQKGKKPERFDLLPWKALGAVARLYDYGATKYRQPHNWRLGYDWSLSFAAMQRHLASFWEGEDIDSESGQPHLTSAVFHALALITYGMEGLGTDDRPHQTLKSLREKIATKQDQGAEA